MTTWVPDGIDPQWLVAEGIGAVRGPRSYRQDGWWFLPAWLPDEDEHDIGPFKSKAAACAKGEQMARAFAKDAEQIGVG